MTELLTAAEQARLVAACNIDITAYRSNGIVTAETVQALKERDRARYRASALGIDWRNPATRPLVQRSPSNVVTPSKAIRTQPKVAKDGGPVADLGPLLTVIRDHERVFGPYDLTTVRAANAKSSPVPANKPAPAVSAQREQELRASWDEVHAEIRERTGRN